jgi:hypothetical protein
MGGDSKKTLADNVAAIIRHRDQLAPDAKVGVSKVMRLGFANGTAQRILGAGTSIGLDILTDLADKLGVKPWHLLVPGLNPAALPGLTEDSTAWPFPMVDRAEYRALPEADRGFVQSKLQDAIRARLDALGKRTGTGG